VTEVTAGDHFERVAAAYESLRTTDEAPVRRISQLPPGRPVTGLEQAGGGGKVTAEAGGLACGQPPRDRRLGSAVSSAAR
jgi:hypothetical protein